MKTKGEHAGQDRMDLRIALIAVSALALLSFGIGAYQVNTNMETESAMNAGKLNEERLLGEKLQLEKNMVELNGRIESGAEAWAISELSVSNLRRRLDAALKHADGLEAAARKSNKLGREVADLKGLGRQLEMQLATARSNEQDVRDQLATTLKERDELNARLAMQNEGARMVNNAQVEALRGRKDKLTVVARRTRTIRMAFDLPEDLAKGASFRIIAPGGHSYTGAEPAVSVTVRNADDQLTASVIPVALTSPTDRAARVHLKFTPEKKLEAGTYRIDVMADGAYLSTVLLDLR